MTERLRSGCNSANISAKMSNDLTPRKTMLIIVIVVGCFAVLWPKVFYPMLVGSANQHIKPSPIDKTTGCCDVISEIDVNTIKIMSELCRTIIQKDEDVPLSGRELVAKCQSAVLKTCGIDISAVLQEKVRLGQSVKQILDQVRSLNGSLCLKYNFGVAPWRLGVPHRVTVKTSPSTIRQERPLHLRSELVHPAFRERGRAIPQPQVTSSRTTTARVIEGRPGPIPAMRPTLGGAGHVVPPPKQGTGSMGLIMPIYTIGIVIFFTYTVLKIIFKKQPEALYPPVEPDPNFRKEVFESDRGYAAPKLSREGVSSKLVVNAMSALLDEVDQEIESRRVASEIAEQNVVANGNVRQEEEQPSVKVLGMEMTASCEGGKKWSRPGSPVLPSSSPPAQEQAEPPQEIFLEGALPAQSHLLVADSATEAEKRNSEEDPAVVLAGKMTLSVISLDSSENGADQSLNQKESSSSCASDEFEKIEADDIKEAEGIADSVQRMENLQLLERIQNEMKEIDEKSTDEPLPSEEAGETLTDETNTELFQAATELVTEERNQQIESDISAESETEVPVAGDIIKSGKEVTISGYNSQGELFEVKKETISEETGGSEGNVGNVIEENRGSKLTDKRTVEANNTLDEIRSTNVPEESKLAQANVGEPDSQKEYHIQENIENITSKEINPPPPDTAHDIIEVTAKPQSSTLLEMELPRRTEEFLSEQPPSNVPEPQILARSEENVGTVTSEQQPLVTTAVDPQLSRKNEENTSEPSLANVSGLPSSSNTSNAGTLVSSVSESLSSSHISDLLSSDMSEPLPVASPVSEVLEQVKSSLREHHERSTDGKDLEGGISQSELTRSGSQEGDTFEKLNEAISSLSAELRSKDNDEDDVVEKDDKNVDNDEEVEIECDDSENEIVEEEIQNINSFDNEMGDLGVSGRINGDNQENSKYGTTSSSTLAEQDISDEELLENEDDEDVEVEEIIEYVTDDEEEAEDGSPPLPTSNTNHISEHPNSQ